MARGLDILLRCKLTAVLPLVLVGCSDARNAPPADPVAPPTAGTPAAPTPPAAPTTTPTPPAAPIAKDAPPSAPAPGASIGSATMEADGTIVLQLRAETGGAVGDALLRYPPDHAQYAMIRAHVGPIEPGQSRPVPPFPEPGVYRYKVKKRGTVLGTIAVRPGEPGELTLSADDEDAKRLAELWKQVETEKSFSISMHAPTADGGRGALGARIYRVSDDDYPKAVHWKLLDANYDVEVLSGE